jgi:hypothetical protein
MCVGTIRTMRITMLNKESHKFLAVEERIMIKRHANSTPSNWVHLCSQYNLKANNIESLVACRILIKLVYQNSNLKIFQTHGRRQNG